MKAIINGKIITEHWVLEGKTLLYEEKIIDIIDDENLNEDYTRKSNNHIEIIDAKGRFVGPGFIDLHIHGSGGSDIMDGTLEALHNISTTICKRGVTGFLPTTMTMEIEKIYKALDTVKEAMNLEPKGARIMGAHLEGPFISEKYKGAQSLEYIKAPDFDNIKEYLDVIKIITLAPEMDKNHDFIKRVKQETAIVLSIGHSDASYEETMKSINNGVIHATHTFNAMSPLNHRKPGIIGAIFNSNISCELIADKIHVHPDLFNLLVRIKGIEKVVLVTDCIRAGSVGEGIYDLGGQQVLVKDNTATLMNGALAGSILDLNLAVKNMCSNTDLDICEVMRMASLNPAQVLGIEHRKGSIMQGKDADMIIFDEEFSVYTTIVEGKIVFER